MDKPSAAGRTRQPERTREAILDAAERLFAERGYEGASLQQIGEAAGVSRGTPAYFFGSKDGLYGAVLERIFAAELALIAAAGERAVASGGGPIEVIVSAIESFIDFLHARPSFVRLVEREALSGGRHLRDAAAHSSAMRESLTAVAAVLENGPFRRVEPAQFLLSALALCWFPWAHADTFARALGLDPDSPEFVEQWKHQVIDLVLYGTLASNAVRPVQDPRAGWDDAFRRMAQRGDDQPIDGNWPATDFDKAEWEW